MLGLPTLNSLKQKLNIQKLNTGKTINYRGIVYDDIESLHAMGNIDGKVVLKSGLEWSFFQYRGQINEYQVCNANLYRTLDNNEIFEIASFFATCEFDPIAKEYKPYYNSDEPGVIYIYNEAAHFMNVEDIKFEYLGWQGLPRPEEQKASIYHLNYDDDFAKLRGVKKHYFKHSKSISKRVWNKFNKGKTLFPDDVAADLANECKKLLSFTNIEINIAKVRFNQWTNNNFKDEYFLSIIEKKNISTVENSKLDWGLIMDMKESYWLNKLNETFQKTRSRMIAYL